MTGGDSLNLIRSYFSRRSMNISFRPLTANDWHSVADIYRQGIDTGHATFQQEVPSWTEWDKAHLPHCRLVALYHGDIAGWAALSAVSSRLVYRGVAEVSIYIISAFHGQKIGSRLLGELITESEQQGIWTLQAGIFPENKASLALHTRHGFRTVGFREKIGFMHGVWRDTVLLERRSRRVYL